jgi:putative transposase
MLVATAFFDRCLSITMQASFCIEAVQEALENYGAPDIFNMDQGSQFTSEAFTSVLLDHGNAISMDGRGAWRGNAESIGGIGVAKP